MPAVTLPKTGGGTASFTDVTDTTASASDVASGKYFYTSAGVRTEGTGSGGGTVVTENDVNFIDYDGTILYSYSAEDFANLTELPPNPTHTGLTAQGWNWALADAKLQVQNMGIADIGQNYVTDDGATRVYIEIEDLARPKFQLYIANNSSGATTTINWGDGNTTSITTTTLTTYSHNYSSVGEYMISIKTSSGVLKIGGTNYTLFGSNGSASYWLLNRVKKVEIGSNLTSTAYLFQYCTSLTTVSLPTTITSLGNYTFGSCGKIECLVLPSGFNTWGRFSCSGSGVRRISLPKSLTSLGENCLVSSRFTRIAIPYTLTSISTKALQTCTALKKVKVPGAPTITSYFLDGCSSCTEIEFMTGTTNLGASACKCSRLTKVTIPEGVTTIGASCFQGVNKLVSIALPSTLTTISGTYVFYQMYGLKEMRCLATTPPAVENSNSLSTQSTDLVIYVPAESLADYQAATNWSTYASHMVGV